MHFHFVKILKKERSTILKSALKIVYFQIIIRKTSGIFKKVTFQISALRKLNTDVTLVLAGNSSIDSLVRDDIDISYKKVDSRSEWNLARKIRFSRDFAHLIEQELEVLSGKDIIYLRYPYPIFYYPKIFYKKFRRCKLVFEHNTIEFREFLLEYNFGFLLSELLFGKMILKQADGIVGVTDEVTEYQLKRTEDPNKPHITIGNGFDVGSVKVRNPVLFDKTELHLLCVANVSKWHGLDRILNGMAEYKGDIRIIFHVAGEGPDIPFLKKKSLDLGIQERVIFHGFLTGKKLDDIFDSCHFAVGSLGIHRIGLNQASILKAREYCARGIPFIYGYTDPDFPEDFPHQIRVKADEQYINVQDIIDFVSENMQNDDYRFEMRQYALKNLDWSIKMMRLKSFFESILQEK